MRLLVATTAVALSLAACGSGGEPSSLGGSPLACSDDAPPVEVSGELGAKPTITIPDAAPPCELTTTDLVEGEGEEAVAGATLSMQYLGVSWSTGTSFDASWDRGQPFEFTLGAGQVIQGWDQGIAGMKVGGRRVLVIPSELAYGDQPPGEDIAPGETLVFVVDLTGVASAPECREQRVTTGDDRGIQVRVEGPANRKPKVTIPDGDPPCTLQMVDVRKGTGPAAKAGDELTMQYVGISWSNHEEFDASWGRDPFTFTLGSGQVIPGWDKGIEGMKAGGRRLLVIPSELAYGAGGASGVIAPFETLVFVVDLVSVG